MFFSTGIVKFVKPTLAPGKLFLATDLSVNELPHFLFLPLSPEAATCVCHNGRARGSNLCRSNSQAHNPSFSFRFPFVFLSFDWIRPGVKNASTRNRSIDSSNNLFLFFFLIYFSS